MLPLRHMAKKWSIINKKVVFFSFKFVIWNIQYWKNIGHIQNKLSRCYILQFKKKILKLSNLCQRKYVLAISVIMFYDKSIAVLYKVIISNIYSFINNFLCIDYLGIVQQQLSDFAYNNRLEKRGSMICLGWVFLKF